MRAQLISGARAGHAADVLHAAGEAVALALEAEQARTAERFGLVRTRSVGRDMRECRGDDLRELALEPRHLRAQRTTGSRLVE